MNYTTIKIPSETHRKIKNLAFLANISQQELLALSLNEFEKKIFWEQCKLAYNNNTSPSNPTNPEDETLYDNTLMDGLEDEY